MMAIFLKKQLRFSTYTDKMSVCQSPVVADYLKQKGGYQWR
jgi:hypothetical protein